MEKITCSVIQDLLPLYCDEVCSEDSCEIVEKHLENCQECRGMLEKMKKECILPRAEERDQEMIVRDMAATWKRCIRRSFLKGVLIMLCMCAVTAGGWFALTRLVMVSVPADRIEIAVENVTDEAVEISLRCVDGKKVLDSSFKITEDGKYYIILKRGILAVTNGGGENWENDITVSRNRRLESGEKVSVTQIYYGTGKDSVLVWEESILNP